MSITPLGRIVEVSERGRHIGKDRGFLVVSMDDRELGRVPLEDIQALILSNPACTVTGIVLAELSAAGVPCVVCGPNHSPSAILWPTAGHHAQQRRMEAQLAATRPLGKRLWALIVTAKLRHQAWALKVTGKRSGSLERMAGMVKSGDPENLEAQGARRYWPLLMGEGFRRDTDGDGANALLNYGYTVLRAATARAIAAQGLHPGIGVFHRHPNNPMPLADDMMEPFRPYVDVEVHRLLQRGVSAVTAECKQCLVSVLSAESAVNGVVTTLSARIQRLAGDLAQSFLEGQPRIDCPAPSVTTQRALGLDDDEAP